MFCFFRDGVMVAQEILDLLVWVRALVPEPFFYLGAMVKRLRRRPLKAKSRVCFSHRYKPIGNFKALRTHVLGVFFALLSHIEAQETRFLTSFCVTKRGYVLSKRAQNTAFKSPCNCSIGVALASI